MSPEEIEALPSLKVSTGWIDLLAIGEPTVRLSIKGYAPVLPVKAIKTGLDYALYISAKSIGEALEPLRRDNGYRFSELKFRIRKGGTDKFAPYLVEPLL